MQWIKRASIGSRASTSSRNDLAGARGCVAPESSATTVDVVKGHLLSEVCLTVRAVRGQCSPRTSLEVSIRRERARQKGGSAILFRALRPNPQALQSDAARQAVPYKAAGVSGNHGQLYGDSPMREVRRRRSGHARFTPSHDAPEIGTRPRRRSLSHDANPWYEGADSHSATLARRPTRARGRGRLLRGVRPLAAQEEVDARHVHRHDPGQGYEHPAGMEWKGQPLTH